MTLILTILLHIASLQGYPIDAMVDKSYREIAMQVRETGCDRAVIEGAQTIPGPNTVGDIKVTVTVYDCKIEEE